MFDVQPGGSFIAKNISAKRLIEWAYDIKDFQVSGCSGWMGADLYDISAKPENSGNAGRANLMLQSLLAERFQLAIRRETKDMPGYALVVAKNGAPGAVYDGSSRPVDGSGGDMTMLAFQLSNFLGRTVVNKTGLTGRTI